MVVVHLPTGNVPHGSTFRRPDCGVLHALKHSIRSLETGAGMGHPGAIPLGIAPIDAALGGGLARAAVHEIAAASESAMAAASGFAMALASSAQDPRAVLWIVEDMGLAENGAPYGPGLDDFGLAPERLVRVAAAKPRDVLWTVEEALRCRAVGAVIGEIRSVDRLDLLASRRLSVAAGSRDVCAFLLCAAPAIHASAAATRWTVASMPSRMSAAGPGPPRLLVHLTRNRHGPAGSWILELNGVERRFDLSSSLSQPVADAAFDRPHRATALGA